MLLTLDIGTSNLKTGIFFRGKLLKVAHRPLKIMEGNFVEVASWISSFASCIDELSASVDLSQLRALICDGNGPTLVPVPGDMASLWLDRTAQKESQMVSSKLGYFVDSSFFLPKIIKMKTENRERYNQTEKFFTCADFFTWYLTGKEYTVRPPEGLEKFYWNDEILDRFDLDKNKFPPFIDMGIIVGNVEPVKAKLLKLPEIPVFSGPVDFVTSILGCGAVEKETVCDRSGTSEGINLCSTSKKEDSRLMCYRHPNQKDWNISGIISTTGKAIEWIKNLILGNNSSFEEFYQLASKSPVCSNGIVFHPYLEGERAPLWDIDAKANFFNISSSTTREDFARSVCEGVCFAIKDVINVIDRPIKEVRVTGGPANSDFLNQMKSDILGVRVITLSSSESDLYGLAVIGYTGLGDYKTIKESCGSLIKVKKVFYPDVNNFRKYEKNFKIFKEKQTELGYGNCNKNSIIEKGRIK